MNEIDELYQQVILDHNKNPRNFGIIDNYNHTAEGHNPLCGDHLNLYVLIQNNIISEISFEGDGCAISKASASIMTTLLKGKTIEEAEQLFGKFHDVVTSSPDKQIDMDSLGKIAVFGGVREFPSRIKCASLAWHTLKNAISNAKDIVSTE